MNSQVNIDKLAEEAYLAFMAQNPSNAKRYLVELLREVKREPKLLNESLDLGRMGKAFNLMIHYRISNDDDILQLISSVGYVVLTKAIKASNDIYLIWERLALLMQSAKYLKYTIAAALKLNTNRQLVMSSLWEVEAGDAIMKMEISDFGNNPILADLNDILSQRKEEYDRKINNQHFFPEITVEAVTVSGNEIHERLFDYLSDKILVNGNIDF